MAFTIDNMNAAPTSVVQSATANTVTTNNLSTTTTAAIHNDDPCIDTVRALYDYLASDPTCLSLKQGDVIHVHFKDPSGWWEGTLGSKKGWFPSNYIEPIQEQLVPPSPLNATHPHSFSRKSSLEQLSTTATNANLSIGRKRSGSLANARIQIDALTNTLEHVMGNKNAFDDHCVSTASTDSMHTLKQPDIALSEKVMSDGSDNTDSIAINTQSTTFSDANINGNSPSHGEELENPSGLNRVTQSLDLPHFWHRKTNPTNGQTYFFNTHTNQTTYNIEDVKKATPRRRSLIYQDNKFVASQEKALPVFVKPSNVPDWGSESLVDSSVTISWELLINNILKSIADLNYFAKNQIKSRYVEQTYQIVRAIRDMLASSGTISTESELMKVHPGLASHHSEIMSTLSKLVLASKVASGLWPPPDSANRMRQQAGQVLLSVRHFVAVAQDTALKLSHAPKELLTTFDIKGGALSDQELVGKLDNYSKLIMDKLAALVTQITSASKSESTDFVLAVRECVTHIGELLSIIEDFRIDFHDDPDRLVDGLVQAKERVYMCVTELVNQATVNNGTFTPSDALASILESTSQVMIAVENILIASKLVIDRKDELGTLEWQPVESAQTAIGIGHAPTRKHNRLSNDSAGTGADRNPDLVNLQRRTLSMTLMLNSSERLSTSSTKVTQPPSTTDLTQPTTVSHGMPHPMLGEIDRSFSASDSNLVTNQLIKQQHHFHQATQHNQSQQPHPHSSYITPLPRKQSIIASHARMSSGNGTFHASNPQYLSNPSLALHSQSNRDSSSVQSSMHGSSVPDRYSANSSHFNGAYDFEEDHPRVKSFESGQLKLKKFFGDGDVPINVPTRISADNLRPFFLNKEYRHEDITFNMEGAVNGGTFDALVERLTLHDQPVDPGFANAFLLTFHLFATSEQLFNALTARFNMSPPPGLKDHEVKMWIDKKLVPIQIRVSNAFKTWLESHWIEADDDACLDRLYQFASTVMSQTHAPLATRLMDLVTKKINVDVLNHNTISTPKFKRLAVRSEDIPQPILPRNMKRFSLLDIDPIEVARQLTLIESQMYARIKPFELMKQEWAKKKLSTAVNVRAMSQLSTRIAGWVVATILSDPDTKRRSQIIKYFIKVADNCLEMYNFNSLMAIQTGLNSSTIARLKKTWDALSAKTKTMFQNIQRVTNHGRNYYEYRALLKRAPLPSLPFVGLFLTDLTFTDDGNPNRRNDGRLINFDKYAKTAKIIQDLQRFQLPFVFIDVAELQQYLLECISREGQRDAQELYEISLAYEPRDHDYSGPPGGGGPPSATLSSGSASISMDDPLKDMANKIRMLEKAGML
ncbi:hypothetical protein BATDEDRAFT_88208 [Batrachochytrium dendrobatidis JAM81]|uniref:Ras GEF n=1 Tax=Batrachochytrium dendrobatidis (strain JAM81 / FGSC 10211) TaxID=684364 RepID=F4P126_BATDJ|nr:uncharacterized protein BATDEDRAFT_88208 [Batrachochytrium dendrobatidis JAM81]EGF80978.1 hypothetical protein BATDEDRAFT_88208 [Batrachochytrium dendrobatidis JAM81]KAJ8328913.1 hypothetical protein O5D80_002878 [Batrachochytrium dendrobatidis]KAK5668860.1 hypothetical protein QVD99_004640 [Batrachochytrium dendrobatidis]|eukprot:XP_006678771.1 hypothetical protein BATDEDRAFT_88208 [Batrachochytrium dendrobatidis JAM81]